MHLEGRTELRLVDDLLDKRFTIARPPTGGEIPVGPQATGQSVFEISRDYLRDLG
jgi:hypothetical protein